MSLFEYFFSSSCIKHNILFSSNIFFFNRYNSLQSLNIILRIVTALAQSAKEKVIPETKTLGTNTFKTKLGADSA